MWLGQCDGRGVVEAARTRGGAFWCAFPCRDIVLVLQRAGPAMHAETVVVLDLHVWLFGCEGVLPSGVAA